MNIFKKMYCRIFQTGFYIALPILPYREPKIYDSVEEIPNVLIEKEINSVLLVTDKEHDCIQEFIIEDDTLSFTGLAIAKNKTAYNRIAKAKSVEKFGKTSAIL